MFPLKKFSLNKPKLTIGDRVRLSKHKSLFENKYSRNWTREIFTVHKIKYTDPISYVIKDQDDEIITGAFYTLELQKTKFLFNLDLEKIQVLFGLEKNFIRTSCSKERTAGLTKVRGNISRVTPLQVAGEGTL